MENDKQEGNSYQTNEDAGNCGYLSSRAFCKKLWTENVERSIKNKGKERYYAKDLESIVADAYEPAKDRKRNVEVDNDSRKKKERRKQTRKEER